MKRVKLGDWFFDDAEYDAENDVLYLTMGKPRPGYGEETPEGHVLRYDEEGEFCGVTLIGARGILSKGGCVDITVPPRTSPRREYVTGGDLRKVLV